MASAMVKISYIASSPGGLSAPLRVVELGRPTDDKFHLYVNEIGIPTVLESSVVQIKRSLLSCSSTVII